MRIRCWFRKGGASDGLWWTAEIDGIEWHCSELELSSPTRTAWENDPDRPRGEQRHFVETTASAIEWDGARLLVS